MRRFGFALALLMVPTLLAVTPGCGDPYKKEYPAEPPMFGGRGGGVAKKGTVELASTGWGTIKGRVTFEGEPPAMEKLSITKDEKVCLCDEALMRQDHLDKTWIVKSSGGVNAVKNVVIFLKAPAGKHFKIPEAYKDVSQNPELGKKVLDQPFCSYDPRVLLLYPNYFNGEELMASGQTFIIKNSAAVPHNTKIKCNPLYNRDYDSGNIQPGSQVIGPSLKAQDTPISVSCDIHPWMRGVIWAFDHPFAALTDADGNFEIKNVPAGAELSVVVWHEGIGFLSAQGFDGRKGKNFTFTADKTEEINIVLKK